jgi:hypothetical protein
MLAGTNNLLIHKDGPNGPTWVCMYAHVREGDMHIAERVKKKLGPSGTGTRPAAPREAYEPRKKTMRESPGAPAKKNASAPSLAVSRQF